jgi:hypothetical protein
VGAAKRLGEVHARTPDVSCKSFAGTNIRQAESDIKRLPTEMQIRPLRRLPDHLEWRKLASRGPAIRVVGCEECILSRGNFEDAGKMKKAMA